MVCPDPATVSGPVGARLTVPTHLSPQGGQTTHPSVLHIPGGLGGFTYWMAHTPYPGGNDDHEDPNIVASNDGITWVVPAGLVNPIADADGKLGGQVGLKGDVARVQSAVQAERVGRQADHGSGERGNLREL